jgi:integrase
LPEAHVHLKIGDIDSKRMLIHVLQGKGSKDRDVPLSPRLLETLREYWRWAKLTNYLFPGQPGKRGTDVPLTTKAVWHACHGAAQRAGIQKKISPHGLRHYAACRTMPRGSRRTGEGPRNTGDACAPVVQHAA